MNEHREMTPEFVAWLETISDKIRRGEPVGIREAMAAIEYQHQRQAYLKQNVWWRRALRWLTHNDKVSGG